MHFRDRRDVHVSEVGVLGFGRILLHLEFLDDVVILVLEIFLAEVIDDRLAILLLLVRALVPESERLATGA